MARPRDANDQRAERKKFRGNNRFNNRDNFKSKIDKWTELIGFVFFFLYRARIVFAFEREMEDKNFIRREKLIIPSPPYI